MDLLKFDNICREFSQKAIDAEMLVDIEKLSRYNGEAVYGENVSIVNMGVVRVKRFSPKIDIINLPNGKFDVKIDDSIKEVKYNKYDLTVVNSSSVCSEYCSFLLVSERPEKYASVNERRKLFVYCVTWGGRGTKKLPSINKVKKDIRNKVYTQYSSILYEFCGTYSLVRPNDNCDKMATCYTLVGIIDQLTHYIPETFKMEVSER